MKWLGITSLEGNTRVRPSSLTTEQNFTCWNFDYRYVFWHRLWNVQAEALQECWHSPIHGSKQREDIVCCCPTNYKNCRLTEKLTPHIKTDSNGSLARNSLCFWCRTLNFDLVLILWPSMEAKFNLNLEENTAHIYFFCFERSRGKRREVFDSKDSKW